MWKNWNSRHSRSRYCLHTIFALKKNIKRRFLISNAFSQCHFHYISLLLLSLQGEVAILQTKPILMQKEGDREGAKLEYLQDLYQKVFEVNLYVHRDMHCVHT